MFIYIYIYIPFGDRPKSRQDQVQVPFNNAAISVRCAAFTEAGQGRAYPWSRTKGFFWKSVTKRVSQFCTKILERSLEEKNTICGIPTSNPVIICSRICTNPWLIVGLGPGGLGF